jgi:TolA-binding protein
MSKTLRHSNRAKRAAVPLAEGAGALRQRLALPRRGLVRARLPQVVKFLVLCEVLWAGGGLAAERLSLSYQAELAQLRERVQTLRREVSHLREENSQLKKQNESLLAENRTQRRVLLENEAAANSTHTTARPVAQLVPPAPAAARQAATNQPALAKGRLATHWLSTADGKRHNSQCRFYKKTVGRPCAGDEGGMCSVCGD